jgi:hypothetical protein
LARTRVALHRGSRKHGARRPCESVSRERSFPDNRRASRNPQPLKHRLRPSVCQRDGASVETPGQRLGLRWRHADISKTGAASSPTSFEALRAGGSSHERIRRQRKVGGGERFSEAQLDEQLRRPERSRLQRASARTKTSRSPSPFQRSLPLAAGFALCTGAQLGKGRPTSPQECARGQPISRDASTWEPGPFSGQTRCYVPGCSPSALGAASAGALVGVWPASW